MRETVVVTGAGGFLGRSVCEHLTDRAYTVRALVRSPVPDLKAAEQHVYSGLDDEQGMRGPLRGADAVIHLAARVHRTGERGDDLLAEYRSINTEGTRRLAYLAGEEGTRELLFASSVKAMGEENERAWTEADSPSPADPYGVSKLEAERVLAEVTAETGLRTVALRLPLAYGPGVKANMLRLFELVDRGIPLPFCGIDNARSLLYSGNAAATFAGLIGKVRGHEVFLAADGEDVSIAQLIRRIAAALERPVRLLPAPRRMLRLLERLDMKLVSPAARRLVGSLTVDASRLRARIGPMPFSMEDGLRATAQWYRSRRDRL